jgi:Papain-like cysteine protease AvrRpt2
MRTRGRTSWLLAAGCAAALSVLVLPALSAPGGDARASLVTAFAERPVTPVDNQHHLYVLDGHGTIHPVGDSRPLEATMTWPNKDVAYSLALFPDGTGGYVLNAWGGLDAVGSAPAIDSGAGLTVFGIAHAIVMTPWSSSADPEGYLLDGYGGIHPFGGAPVITGNATWSSDVARAMVLTADSTRAWVKGYTLDAHGGISPFGGAQPVSGNAYWPGLDIARGLVLQPRHRSMWPSGYTLDGYGGIHPFGGAPPIAAPALWPGKDLADSIVSWTGASVDSPGGWVLDRHGGVHAYGSAPALSMKDYWPDWDIARGLGSSGAGGGGSKERTLVDPEPLGDAWGAYYNQRDARWGPSTVGVSQYPVWEIGCLLTDLAMVYTHFGYRNVTPATVAATSGFFSGNGSITDSAFNIPGHPATVNRRPSLAWISARLAAGHPVIVGMNLPGGGTHFIVLTAPNGASDFWANDPWDQNGMHVQFSGDWDDRGAVYEAITFA